MTVRLGLAPPGAASYLLPLLPLLLFAVFGLFAKPDHTAGSYPLPAFAFVPASPTQNAVHDAACSTNGTGQVLCVTS